MNAKKVAVFGLIFCLPIFSFAQGLENALGAAAEVIGILLLTLFVLSFLFSLLYCFKAKKWMAIIAWIITVFFVMMSQIDFLSTEKTTITLIYILTAVNVFLLLYRKLKPLKNKKDSSKN